MSDKDIDKLLAGDSRSELDPALLDRVSHVITSSMKPVKPLPPAWVAALGLAAVCVAIAFLGAAKLGMYGLDKLNGPENSLMVAFLGLFTWSAAMLCANETRPGSVRRIGPKSLLIFGSLFLVGLSLLVFHDYGIDDFVAAGIPCLRAGLLFAIPTGVVNWLQLRRGYAVDPVSAGLATGTLASLAGVTMLELHCPNAEAVHNIVWHVSVVPLSAAMGALFGWLLRRRG